MVGTMPFFDLRILSGKRMGEIIETDIWSRKEAEDKAKKAGKSLRANVGVFQVKQVSSTETGETEIEGW